MHINKKFIRRIMIVLIVLYISVVYLSSLEGFIVDAESGKPIKDAYIFTSMRLYPWPELINPAGSNSDWLPVSITKTDDQGHFKLNSFIRLFFGIIDYREIVVFKNGYNYRRFFQSNALKMRESVFPTTYPVHLPYFSKPVFLFYKEHGEPDGIIYASFETERFASKLKRNKSRKYEYLKPVFIELYELFNSDSERIKTAFINKNTIEHDRKLENWEYHLKRLKETLYSDQ